MKRLLALSFCPMAATPRSIAGHLRSLLRGDVEFDPVTRRLYATDAGLMQIEPLGVVCPKDAEDVAKLVSFAAQQGLSVVPRGMGSGLCGGAVGAGIQIDFSRHMRSVVSVAEDPPAVRVQPGLVLSELNRALRPRNLFFAPDPSSENHCSLGGMIGTNASGPRTVAYGATKDHVLSLQVVLADGSTAEVSRLPAGSPTLAAFLHPGSLAGRGFASVLGELERKHDVISTHTRGVVKNSCGYRLEALLSALRQSPSGLALPLHSLFIGAEGTLGIVTEATLQLVRSPAERGVAMVYFPSLSAAGEAAPGILSLAPTAVEIMDSSFLRLVRSHDPSVDAMLPAGADTALLVEFEADDPAELDAKYAALGRRLSSTSALQIVRATSAAEAASLWRMRKSAVALMQQTPGRRQPLPFIEDITVPPSRVPECIAFLQKLFEREGLEAVTVGHVGDGNLHTRPMLDPRDPADRVAMQRIYEEVTGYVLSAGGTLSGEHGDGLVHTPHLERLYGPETYGVFESVKTAFDPQNVLNPGKKVALQDDSHDLLAADRYGPGYRTSARRTRLFFAGPGYEAEIERCHGCAACKATVGTTMCPVYKATCCEHASPRAKANLLRGVISGSIGQEAAAGSIRAVLDYCIGCGMCATECPSGVNIPKLVIEAKARHWQHRPLPSWDESVLSRASTVARLGQALAPVGNRVLGLHWARVLAEHGLGIDRKAVLPPFTGRRFKTTAGKAGVHRACSSAEALAVASGRILSRGQSGLLLRCLHRLLRARTGSLRAHAPRGTWGGGPPAATEGEWHPRAAIRAGQQSAKDRSRQRPGGLALCSAGRGCDKRRADRLLRFQGPLPRSARHAGELLCGCSDIRFGGVPARSARE